MMRKLVLAVAFLAALGLAGTLSAQLADDRVPHERTVPLREQVKNELATYPRRLGPIRLFPQFQLRNFGYNSNVYGTEDDPTSDYTATVAAGARYLVPFGQKVFLRGDVMPEYTYYHELEENRTLGGNYTGSLLGLYNRMSFEVGASRTDQVQVVSSESERVAEANINGAVARLEVDVLPRVALFGSFVQRDYSYDVQGSDGNAPLFDQLERSDDAVRAGVRYRVTSFFDVSAAMEKTTSEFEVEPALRDNESDAMLVGVHYDRPRMFVDLSAGLREGEGSLDGTAYPDYSELTGSYYLNYKLGRPVELETYGNRSVVNGLFVSNPWFLETRGGAGVVFHAGDRVIVRAFGETGSNEYPEPVLVGGADIVQRADDVLTYGTTLAFRIWRSAALEVGATQTEYDSNIDGFDRSVLRVSTGIRFRPDFQ